MNKKLIGGLIVGGSLLTLSTVFAATGGLNLNIDGLKNLALQNSKQLMIDDLDIKAKEVALEDANEDSKSQILTGTRDQLVESKSKMEVAPMQAEAGLELAKKSKVTNEEDLQLNIYKSTYRLLLLKKQFETEEAKTEILKERYNMAKSKYDEGKITENDLQDVKYSLDNKIIEWEKVSRSLEGANLELKVLLNLPLDDTPVNVEEELVAVKWQIINMDKAVENAIKKNPDIFKKSEELKAKEKTFEITASYYNEGMYKHDTAKTEMEIAKLALEDAKVSMEVNVKNKYNDMVTRKDKVDLAVKWEEIQKKKLEGAEIKQKKGSTSKEEVLGIKEKYLDARLATYSAICDYNIAKAEFDSMSMSK